MRTPKNGNGNGATPRNRAAFGPATPFFVVSDLNRTLAFYCGGLGFECWFSAPEDAPFFALIGRGAAQIMLKDVDVTPMPNPSRHDDAPWDAFIYTDAPEILSKDFIERGIALKAPVIVRDDGLTGFEVADPDGYVCFFGHPD